MSASGRDLSASLLRSRLDQLQGQLDRIEGYLTRIEDRVTSHQSYAAGVANRVTALEQWRTDFEKSQGDQTESHQWGVGTTLAVVAIVVSVAALIIGWMLR